jgi:hypothetical protein
MRKRILKTIFAVAVAMSMLTAGVAAARPHHHHAHQVCSMHHHHRVCHWVR